MIEINRYDSFYYSVLVLEIKTFLIQATLVDCRKFALIVVDVQNDFISGSLAVTGSKRKITYL